MYPVASIQSPNMSVTLIAKQIRLLQLGSSQQWEPISVGHSRLVLVRDPNFHYAIMKIMDKETPLVEYEITSDIAPGLVNSKYFTFRHPRDNKVYLLSFSDSASCQQFAECFQSEIDKAPKSGLGKVPQVVISEALLEASTALAVSEALLETTIGTLAEKERKERENIELSSTTTTGDLETNTNRASGEDDPELVNHVADMSIDVNSDIPAAEAPQLTPRLRNNLTPVERTLMTRGYSLSDTRSVRPNRRSNRTHTTVNESLDISVWETNLRGTNDKSGAVLVNIGLKDSLEMQIHKRELNGLRIENALLRAGIAKGHTHVAQWEAELEKERQTHQTLVDALQDAVVVVEAWRDHLGRGRAGQIESTIVVKELSALIESLGVAVTKEYQI